MSAKNLNNKQNCLECCKSFTIKTLNNHNGICGICYKKINKKNSTNKKIDQSTDKKSKKNKTPRNFSRKKGKRKCPDCREEFTETTLRKNGGTCGTCAKVRGNIVVDNNPTRLIMWEKYFGKIDMPCPLCFTEMINPLTCEIGHDIADSKGGAKTLNNVMPICRTCNVAQGNLRFEEFMSNLPKVEIKFQNLSYCQRSQLIRKWGRNKKRETLTDDRIHKTANNYAKFRKFSKLYDGKNYIIFSKNFLNSTNLSLDC